MHKALLPMPPFDWQQSFWTALCERHRAGRLPHANLLVGRDGVGGEELAVALGQYLLCLSPLKNIACGKCRGCQLVDADTHPDLMRVVPEEAGKQIKIDQIRQLSQVVDQTAQQGGYKVLVLSPAESMNLNAANALLKNLEEPAGRTVFILCSQQPSRVLPTIRSRCSISKVPMPSTEQSIAWLASVGVSGADALLSEAGAAPLLAKRWHDSGHDQERLAIVEDLVKMGQKRMAPMAFASKWGKQAPIDVLEPMMNSLESLLADRIGGRSCSEHYDPLKRAVAHCSPAKMMRLRDHLCERKLQLLRSPNLNSALFVEELALDWSVVMK